MARTLLGRAFPAPLVLVLAVAAAPPLAPRALAAPLVVYDDALRNGFQDWSWATHSLAATSPAPHAGTYCISMQAAAWTGLYFHLDGGFAVGGADTLELWVHGGTAAGKAFGVILGLGGTPRGSAALESFVPGGIPAGVWARARVPFAALGITTGRVDDIQLQAWSGADQGLVYFDDVRVLSGTATPEPLDPVAIAIDPSLDRRPVNDAIHGVNLGSTADFAAAPYPLRRWGGNATTRYSWLHDTSNRGSDWFYFNIPESNDHPETLPDGSSLDRFVQETHARGARALVTLPTIGWVPKDRAKRWGYSVAKYGAQQQTECTYTGGASWCTADAGNGRHTDGSPITGNDPLDTSAPFTPAGLAPWLQHLDAYAGDVDDYALDNECMLWHETHRDVHPAKVTYDEHWSRTVAYASAIKAADPTARVWGPVTWGWCDLWTSAADDCVSGADRAAHGGMPLVEWYLAQLGAYEQTHGVRLVDVLDLHYYPQAPNVALTDDENVGATRLRSIRELHDPTYVSESWIGVPVALIPTVRAWIAEHAPWMGLAITEYNWGGDHSASSALAQAEVLAVFGREGVDAATRWVAPEAGTPMVDAFRLHLDYDGAGGRVAGESVRATTADVDRVSAYAVEGADGALRMLLFNKSTAPESVTVAVNGGLSGTLALHRFAPPAALTAAGTLAPSGGGFATVLPARSATLVVGTWAAAAVEPALPAAARFDGASPNPLPGRGTLRFGLADAAAVDLELFDVAGRRVRALARGERLAAGRHAREWDGRGDDGVPVRAGVYFARLRVDHGAPVERLVVLMR